jgi:hypothetical protein
MNRRNLFQAAFATLLTPLLPKKPTLYEITCRKAEEIRRLFGLPLKGPELYRHYARDYRAQNMAQLQASMNGKILREPFTLPFPPSCVQIEEET